MGEARSPEEHLAILANSDFVVLAIDTAYSQVIGCVTALTDHVQSAFIPMLEVLPEYQGQGIGSELVSIMLDKLEDIPAIDLMCDEAQEPFFARFGMRRSAGMIMREY